MGIWFKVSFPAIVSLSNSRQICLSEIGSKSREMADMRRMFFLFIYATTTFHKSVIGCSEDFRSLPPLPCVLPTGCAGFPGSSYEFRCEVRYVTENTQMSVCTVSREKACLLCLQCTVHFSSRSFAAN